MQRLRIFLLILAITFIVLVILASVSWYLSVSAPSYYRSSWIGQMWGSMTGNGYGGMGGMMGNSGSAKLSYYWVIPVALIATVAVAMIGVGFYLVFPQLRYIKGEQCSPEKIEANPSPVKTTIPAAATGSPIAGNVSDAASSCDVLLKTMTIDEQKVFSVLMGHHGKYLQKYVVKEAGLSRLKTHRVVARFAQRGIVTVKEFGNTNEIQLSDWVKDSKPASTTAV
jgi:hypothetical protein